jgi:TrmH family RNA methyltransferase
MRGREGAADAAETIRSRHNPLVRLARAAREGRAEGLIFVEGLRLCEEAARAGLRVEAALIAEGFDREARAAALVDSLAASAERVARVSDEVLASLADTKTPQGVVLVARRPATGAESIERAVGGTATPLVVVIHRVGNPSNAGAMLRVAEAAGATAAVATRNTADLLSPKSLRGAMGSAFRLPLWTGAELSEVVGWCAARGLATVSTSLDAEMSHAEFDWTRPAAIIMGAEAAGLTEDEARAADFAVRIPMRPPVESLNVAVALAVVLYEAARQRKSL